MRPNESDFWNWSMRDDGDLVASLNIEAVVQNAVENMLRLEEQATLNVVVKFLEDMGYIVIAPNGEG